MKSAAVCRFAVLPCTFPFVLPARTLSLLRGTGCYKPGRCRARRRNGITSADFIAFVSDVVERTPTPREIHIVLDNLSAHKTQAVRDFLAANPRVRFHFTPTYSRGSIRSKSGSPESSATFISRGVFTSVADLSRKTHEVHPGLCQISQTLSLELLQSCSPHRGDEITEMIH